MYIIYCILFIYKNILCQHKKRNLLSSTLCYGYLLCQNKKYQSYYYSIFVLHVYSSSRTKVWALSCLSCRFYFLYLFLSIHLSFSFLSPLFICARSQFRRSTLLDGETRQDGHASSENPISVELKAIDRYRGITCVTTECYTRKDYSQFPCWNGHFLRQTSGSTRELFIQFSLLIRRMFFG